MNADLLVNNGRKTMHMATRTDISIPFNEMLVGREIICEMAAVVHGLSANGFNVHIHLKGKIIDQWYFPKETFDPVDFAGAIEELVIRIGILRGTVVLLEKQ